MLKLIRESQDVFVVVSDRPGMSGRGTFRQAVVRLLKLQVPMDEVRTAVEELDRDRGTSPVHNVAEFGIGLRDGRPKFIFTEYVELVPRMRGVA